MIMFVWYRIAVFALCSQMVLGSLDQLSPQEKILLKFFGSSRRMGEVLPKRNLTDGIPLTVKFAYILSHIYDIKANEEEVDLGFWISLKWNNQLVSWNTSEYPVKYIEVPSNRLWVPRVYLIENAISQPLSPTVETSNALVHPNGDTTIDFALTIKLSCSMPACLFPADKHTCATTFNSISYDRNILLLQFNQKIVAEYSAFEKLESGLWKITRNPFREVPLITSSGLGYGKSSALSSSLTFTRKPGYYVLTVIGPIVLICIVTFCSVLLPWESGERTSLLITCFLALIVYLDTILNNVPKTSDYIPVIVWFVIIVLIFTILQIAFTALASYYAERAVKKKKFVAPHKRVVNLIKKIFFKSRKKEIAKIKTFKEADYQNGAENDMEIVRKFPPAMIRQLSLSKQASRRKISSDDYLDERENITKVDEPYNAEGKIKGDGEYANVGNDKGEGSCETSPCKKACKLVDRLSVFLSLAFLVFCPIFFQLLFSESIPITCPKQVQVLKF